MAADATFIDLARALAALRPPGVRWTVTREGGGAGLPFIEVVDNATHRFWVIADETDDGSWQMDYYATERDRMGWAPSNCMQVGEATTAPDALAAAIWSRVLQ